MFYSPDYSLPIFCLPKSRAQVCLRVISDKGESAKRKKLLEKDNTTLIMQRFEWRQEQALLRLRSRLNRVNTQIASGLCMIKTSRFVLPTDLRFLRLRMPTLGSWLMSSGRTAGTIRARGMRRANSPLIGAWALQHMHYKRRWLVPTGKVDGIRPMQSSW